jgi:hypothetical protein
MAVVEQTEKRFAVEVTADEALDIAIMLQDMARAGGESDRRRRQYESLAERFEQVWRQDWESPA